jgi:hypothetical protein
MENISMITLNALAACGLGLISKLFAGREWQVA